MDSTYIELKDVAQEISAKLEETDFDPAELDMVNQRLDKIYDLEKKYRVESIDDLLALQQELDEKLGKIENSDEALAELQQQLDSMQKVVGEKAQVLTTQRQQAARQIEQEMQERLVTLGMPNVRFKVEMVSVPFGRNGQDKVSFLFSANTSTALQPVSQVASGGEIARVMLALKAMISGAVKLPTIVFDEIDTGVSGKIAEQMAGIMYEMGQHGRQVISITHLPQIAAQGSTHYKVYKEETAQGTTSHMQLLSDEQRVSEIAQMLSGTSVSDAAIENAKQLMGGKLKNQKIKKLSDS
jgi:DNA repair protein RecN (Recombination protein N)